MAREPFFLIIVNKHSSIVCGIVEASRSGHCLILLSDLCVITFGFVLQLRNNYYLLLCVKSEGVISGRIVSSILREGEQVVCCLRESVIASNGTVTVKFKFD